MALPACIGLVVFLIGPMLVSMLLSTTNWAIGLSPEFVGLSNYRRLFGEDPLFWKSLGVTAYYTLLVVPLTLAVAFMIAVMLNQKVRGLAAFRTVYYLPTLVPMVASAILWNWMFNPEFGLFNEFLRAMG